MTDSGRDTTACSIMSLTHQDPQGSCLQKTTLLEMTVPAAAGAEMTAIEMRECAGSQETPSPHFSSFPTQLPAPGNEGAKQDAFPVMEEAVGRPRPYSRLCLGPNEKTDPRCRGSRGAVRVPGPD